MLRDMELIDGLKALLIERATKDLDWYKRNYEAALARVRDHTDDPDNPYWSSSDYDEAHCVIPGEKSVHDMDGSSESADQAESRAWELLVLADLARLS